MADGVDPIPAGSGGSGTAVLFPRDFVAFSISSISSPVAGRTSLGARPYFIS